MIAARKILLFSLVFLLSVNAVAFLTKAQDDQIEARIFPSEGTASTIILIRFMTINVTIGNVDKADIFWDDFSIAVNEQGIERADGSYNYYLNVPAQPPFSDIGNHTIRVDSSVLNYGQISFNFTFIITRYAPYTEYAVLNATYYSLLNNYTSIMNNYNLLYGNYTRFVADYNLLLANYNTLSSNFNLLSSSYDSLSANFENLQSLYIRLIANYTNLQGNFDSLSANYNSFRADFNSLNSSYLSLESNYDGLLGELALNRSLNYVLITSTIVLAAVVVYLIMKKPKSTTKTRY